MTTRYAVLGLATARSPWFGEVARWSTSGRLPVQFEMCVSAAELLARLDGARPWSAVLIDGHAPGLDRDLFSTARRVGAAPLVVGGDAVGRGWRAIGAAAVLHPELTPESLLDALAIHATALEPRDRVPDHLDPSVPPSPALTTGRVVVVTGPGGTGASTLAAALAQHLGGGPGAGRRHRRTPPPTRGADRVVLADLALHADQAMLHDLREVSPGVVELADAHRSADLSPSAVRAMTFEPDERPYDVLVGLRRAREWTMLRPRALRAAIDSLCRAYDLVVADVTADFDGEDETGSADVEDRNLLARTALQVADCVVVVGEPTTKGVHSVVRVVADVLHRGVEAGRVVTAFNRSFRQPVARAEASSALSMLLHASCPGLTEGLGDPVHLGRHAVDAAVRDGSSWPAGLAHGIGGAVDAVLSIQPLRRLGEATPEPTPIRPGELGLSAWDAPDAPAGEDPR